MAEEKSEMQVEESAKSNGSTADPGEVEKKIIRQVEYYFGDWNLPRDKFLQEQMKADEGWIPMEVMVRFQRLAQLSTDHAVIAAALKKSTANIVEVGEDGSKIRRSTSNPVPENNDERKKELSSRTVYVKGFDTESSALDELMEYFKQFGTLENLHMRSYNDKATKKHCFKGSVFALFSTKEMAESFMKLESVKYKEVDLIRKWQLEYVEQKRKEHAEHDRARAQKKSGKGSKQQQQKGKGKASEGASQEKSESKEDGDKEEKEEDEFPRGAVLYMSGCPPALTREDIKAKFSEMGTAVAYVDFKRGDEVGWVRLQEANSAPEFMKKVGDTGVLRLLDADIAFKVVEGEEETSFLQRVKVDMEKMKMKAKFSKRGRRGGRSGGSYRGKKRKGGFERGGSSAKKAKSGSD